MLSELPLSKADIIELRKCDLSRLDLAPIGLKYLCDMALLAHTFAEALEKIGSQNTISDFKALYGENWEGGDYEDAYDTIIALARYALSRPTTEPAKAEEP